MRSRGVTASLGDTHSTPDASTASRRVSDHTYDELYEQGSSRLANEGQIGIDYRLPKMFALLRRFCLTQTEPLRVLEIGAGVGEIACMFRDAGIPLRQYVGTEYSLPGAQRMRRAGWISAQANAERLPFGDGSFDVVFCFDVMHHVADPRAMAAEMVRVTRKWFFLSEANGLSPVRKLGELTEQAKSVGEQSYLPSTYRGFFPREQVESIELHPFYVLVPPHTPPKWIPTIKAISELGERVPLLRWVGGQSVAIMGRKRAR
jgi:SAM-dependent methyltransferase